MFYLLYGTAIRQCLKFATCLYLHLQYHIVSSSLTVCTWYGCFICRNRHHYGILRHWFCSSLDWCWYISLFNVTWTYTGHTNDKSKTGFVHWDLSYPLYMIVGNISQHTSSSNFNILLWIIWRQRWSLVCKFTQKHNRTSKSIHLLIRRIWYSNYQNSKREELVKLDLDSCSL